MPAEASVAVRTLFAPFDATTQEYLAFVQGAKQSIYVIIYGFHLPQLTDLLIAKHRAGLHVNLILDHSQAAGRAEASEVAKLVAAGVPLLIGVSPVHHQILHTKATIVDEAAVESGSWNYSLSAAAQSNTLTFVHDPAYARAYLDHFHRLHGALVLHDLIYQPEGAVQAEDVPAADVLPDDSAPPIEAAGTDGLPTDVTSDAAAALAPSSATVPSTFVAVAAAPARTRYPRASTGPRGTIRSVRPRKQAP